MLVIDERIARIQELADLVPADAVNALGLTGFRTSSCKARFYLAFKDKCIAITEITPVIPPAPGEEPDNEMPPKLGTPYIEATLMVANVKQVVATVKVEEESEAGMLKAINALLSNDVAPVGVAKDKKKKLTYVKG